MEIMGRSEATLPISNSATDILARMRSGIKATYVIRLREQEIPVRLLSMDELMTIRREGLKHQASIKGDESDRNHCIHKLVLKFASDINKKKMPLLMDSVLDEMTYEEIAFLYGEYTKVMDDVNPDLERMSPELFRSLVDAVKKKSISAKDCSLRQLRTIFNAYQDLIERAETPNSPPDNTSGS